MLVQRQMLEGSQNRLQRRNKVFGTKRLALILINDRMHCGKYIDYMLYYYKNMCLTLQCQPRCSVRLFKSTHAAGLGTLYVRE